MARRKPRTVAGPIQGGSQSNQGSRSQRQEGSKSGEEFDFAPAEVHVSSSDTDDPLTQPQTQPTNRTGQTGKGDIPTLFKVIMVNSEKKKACTLCADVHGYQEPPQGVKNYVYGANTLSNNLRNHLVKLHDAVYKPMCAEKGWNYPGSKNRQPTVGDNRKNALPPFSEATFLEYLVRFVTADDQAIRVVECVEFRDLCMLLQESLTDKDIPHRDKVREAIFQQFEKEFSALKIELSNSLGRISLTADIWSNKKLRAFLAVTAHWISLKNSKLDLRAALIGFHQLKKKHTGKSIAKTLLHVLNRAGIAEQTGHITMDNAENNTVAMKELQALFEIRKIKFDHKDNRIGCYPHIINICVTHIISSLTRVDAGNLDDASDDDSGEEDERESVPDVEDFIDVAEYDLDDWFENVKQNPVKRARKVIRTVRASGQRREGLSKMIKTGNEVGLFKDEDGISMQIKDLELIRDVKHRWDSLYSMLSRLELLQQPLDLYLKSNREFEPLLLTDGDWDVLAGLKAVLEVPHEVQQVMSAHATPVLSGAIPSFELFMTKWEQLGLAHRNLKPWTDIGLKWANKYYKRMDDTRAYIIAMFINPCIRFSWIEREWDRDYIDGAKKIVLEVMRECGGRRSVTIQSVAAPSRKKAVPTFAALSSKYKLPNHPIYPQSAPTISSDEEEFEKYKNERLAPQETDLVAFWQGHQNVYTKIFPVAMDYLPIQASSVPCEHVFSSAGETDTKKRNRLAAPLMEALQILKFIYKKDRLNFTAGLNTVEQTLPTEGTEHLLAELFTKDNADTTDKLLQACAVGDSDDDDLTTS